MLPAAALSISVLLLAPPTGGNNDDPRDSPPRRVGQPLPIRTITPAGTEGIGTPSITARPPRLRPVDQGYVDRTALSASLKIAPMDMAAVPIGFSRLYQIEGDPDHFVRGNGGLYAIFPQSVYEQTKKGLAPTWGPSTVFSIGMPRSWFLVHDAPGPSNGGYLQDHRDPGTARIDGRVDRSVATRGSDVLPRVINETGSRMSPPRRDPPLPPIVASESYRRAFYAGLLAPKGT